MQQIKCVAVNVESHDSACPESCLDTAFLGTPNFRHVHRNSHSCTLVDLNQVSDTTLTISFLRELRTSCKASYKRQF
ncbi:hypothetical protein TWF225_003207 [Orbilia oligospora]|nr:hypothetical protein TWF225_003207 [Orbilia oligospora]KAF3263029.1 hypothetical protein TWF128_002003 [Orbilia oligospora]KAF3267401.1 hypothetical protein TWF217_000465 [Orbilia oligospora]